MPNYPTSLDTLTNPASGDPLSSPAHHTQHTDANDILEAVETKLGTGASTPTTTGHVLTVTGAGATAYQAASSGNTPLPSLVAIGKYQGPTVFTVTTSTLAPSIDQAFYAPFVVPTSYTYDRIGIRVTTGGAATAVIRLGVYSDSGFGYPGTLVLDAGTVDSTTTGFKEITISQTLAAGLYWVCAVTQVVTSTFRILTTSWGYPVNIETTDTQQPWPCSLSVSGSLPSPAVFGVGDYNLTASIPRVQLRRSA